MDSHRRLLLANKAWVKEKLDLRSDYFERLADSQSPEFFWIGCADSRVPPEELTGTEAGDLFVHRNIANLVIHTDFSMLSALQYAVAKLKVAHIIVCGHYGCGGILAAMSHTDLGLVNKWLRHIKDTYRIYRTEIEALNTQQERFDKLVELNIIEQVNRLVTSSIIQRSWKKDLIPFVHGWVYDLKTGKLKELISKSPGSKIDEIYAFEEID